MTVKETVWLLEAQTIIAITLAPRKILDLLDQTRTGVYSDPLIVHWQTGIPFQKTWDVYLMMLLKFHCLNILNLNGRLVYHLLFIDFVIFCLYHVLDIS